MISSETVIFLFSRLLICKSWLVNTCAFHTSYGLTNENKCFSLLNLKETWFNDAEHMPLEITWAWDSISLSPFTSWGWGVLEGIIFSDHQFLHLLKNGVNAVLTWQEYREGWTEAQVGGNKTAELLRDPGCFLTVTPRGKDHPCCPAALWARLMFSL